MILAGTRYWVLVYKQLLLFMNSQERRTHECALSTGTVSLTVEVGEEIPKRGRDFS